MLAIRPCQQGVSLIETAIALVIIAMMMMMGMPSFSEWIQSSQIRSATESIQNGLQLARAEAVRRNTTVQFSLGTASDWVVGCVTSSTDCPASIQSRVSSEGSVNATVVASQGVVVFNGMGRLTPVPAADITLDVSNPTGGACTPSGPMRCLRIVVSLGGQIRMCDPALTLSSTFPQGC